MKLPALAVFCSLLLFSCSKQIKFDRPATLASELQTQANDAVRISTELDAMINDVDSVLGGAASVCGGMVTVAIDTVALTKTTTISYGGNSCDALRSRTGSVSILSQHVSEDWNSAGDSVTLGFTNILITRLADNKTMGFSGSLMYRNPSGGSLAGVAGGGASVVHTLVGSSVIITYDNATITRWAFARQRTYTYSGGMLISTIGLDSAGSIGGVADWGASRFGNSVVVAPISALVISQGCGWRMTGGQSNLTNPTGLTALSFGLDSTGNATGCPVGGGHYYFKLAWTADGEYPYNAVLPY